MDIRTRTIKEWAELSGISPEAARKSVTRKAGRAHGITSVLTADEWNEWKPGKSGKRPAVRVKKEASVFSIDAPAVQKVTPSEPIEKQDHWQTPPLETLRDWIVDALLIALCIGHAGLIWYELATTYGPFGFIGGGVIFGFIVAAVLLAADRTKNITSTYALIFALVIDLSAVRLHYDSFKDFGAPNDITVAVCAFLGGMSWGALFLFRHKKNN